MSNSFIVLAGAVSRDKSTVDLYNNKILIANYVIGFNNNMMTYTRNVWFELITRYRGGMAPCYGVFNGLFVLPVCGGAASFLLYYSFLGSKISYVRLSMSPEQHHLSSIAA